MVPIHLPPLQLTGILLRNKQEKNTDLWNRMHHTEPAQNIIIPMIVWRWSVFHSGKGDVDGQEPGFVVKQNLIGIRVIVG